MKKILLTALALGAAWCVASAETPEELSNRLYGQIVSAYNAQNWEQVASLVGQLIDAGADVEEFEVNYCNALAKSGRSDEAVVRMEAYLAKCPEDYQGWYVLGDIYAARSETDKAIEAYGKSGELNQLFARPYVAMARLLGVADPAASVDAYCKAMRIFILAEQPQAAIQFGSEAMGVDPGSPQLMVLIGEALTQAGMEDKALSFYAEAISLASTGSAPDLETIGVGTARIGMIFYKKGDYAKSFGYVSLLTGNDELLSALAPEMAQELLMLGAAACNKLGRDEDAQSMLAKARAANPDVGIDDIYQSLFNLGE